MPEVDSTGPPAAATVGVDERCVLAARGGLTLRIRRFGPSVPAGEPPVLLVHGLASNCLMWEGVARDLAARGRTVASVDLRGHGRSDKPDDGYGVAAVAGDVAALLEALGWGPAVVAGQSWGGHVVLQLAADHPSAVAAVAAVDGGHFRLRDRFPEWEACARELAPPALLGTAVHDFEGMIRRRNPDWPETGVAGVLGCFEVRPDTTIAPWLTLPRHLQVLRGLWEHDPLAIAPQVTAPVLLIPARSDGDSWPDKQRAVSALAAGLPDARVAPLDGPHDLHAAHPAAVAGLLAALPGGPPRATETSETS